MIVRMIDIPVALAIGRSRTSSVNGHEGFKSGAKPGGFPCSLQTHGMAVSHPVALG
jgi:hypothetical protein